MIECPQGNAVRKVAGSAIEWANWWLTPRPAPSFVQRYSIQRENYKKALTATGRAWGTLWPWETKDGVRAIAVNAGLHVPERYTPTIPIAELRFDELPDAFVVKPVEGSSKAGVFVLRKQGQAYIDLLRGCKPTSEDEVKNQIVHLGNAGVISADRVFAEQPLVERDDITFDWKVYAFRDKTPLICQILRAPDGRKSCYYDGSWNRLGDIRRGKESSADLPLPRDPEALLAAASRVSTQLSVPFVRVDLYEFRSRIYLGEITPMPGSSQRFSRVIDRVLGEAWESAEASLLARGGGDGDGPRDSG